VVAAKEGDAVGVADLQRQQQQKGLHTIQSTVDEIAKEEIVILGDGAAHFKQLHQVVMLPVDVTADLQVEREERVGEGEGKRERGEGERD